MTASLKSQRRQFWVILTIVFLGYIGISMPYLIFPPLFLNVDYSFLPASWSEQARALFLGFTLAAYPLGQFIGSPILGSLSDDYGRKHLLSISLLVASICNVLSGAAIAWQHVGLLIVSRFIAGLMEGNVAIARAMCADLKGLSKQETFGKINAVTAIAYLIGPLFGGLMADQNLFEGLTTSTPFFFISVLFFCLAGLAALVLKQSVAAAARSALTLWQRFNFIKRMTALFAHRSLKILLITSTCFTLAVDIFYQFGPVYLTLKWNFSPAQLILYNALLSVGLTVGNAWLPAWVSSRVSVRRSMMGAGVAFALVLIGIICTDSNALMMAWFFLAGLAIGVISTLITVKISDGASDRIQGEVLGTQLSLRVLGDGIICLLGGALLILSSKLILSLAAIIALVAMVYYRFK